MEMPINEVDTDTDERTELEDIKFQKQLKSVMRHIKNVQEATQLLGERLIEKGETELGLNLIANGFIHDNSKFHGIEWESLGADSPKDEVFAAAVQHHVKSNPHHPEYWLGGIKEMPRLFLGEMVCDWYSRAIEFGTDLRIWIRDIASVKYGIAANCKTHKAIKEFVDILLDKPFK